MSGIGDYAQVCRLCGKILYPGCDYEESHMGRDRIYICGVCRDKINETMLVKRPQNEDGK